MLIGHASEQAMLPCLVTLGFHFIYREHRRPSVATRKTTKKNTATKDTPSPVYAETSRLIVQACCYCFLSSFMFGWHVHEKAILHVVIPMALLLCGARKSARGDVNAEYQENRRDYAILSIAGYYALLPLLFREDEYLMKVRSHTNIHTCVKTHE